MQDSRSTAPPLVETALALASLAMLVGFPAVAGEVPTTPLDGCALDYSATGAATPSTMYTDRTAVYADGIDTANVYVQLPVGSVVECVEVWSHCSIDAPSTGHGLYRRGDFAEVLGCPAGPAGGWSFSAPDGLVDNSSLWNRDDYLRYDSAVLVDEIALLDDGIGADAVAGDGTFTGELRIEASWSFDNGVHMPLSLMLPRGSDGQGGYYRWTEHTLGIVRPNESVAVVERSAGLFESPHTLFYEDPTRSVYDGPMPALEVADGMNLVGPSGAVATFMKQKLEEIVPGWTDMMVINTRLEPISYGLYASSLKILHSPTGFGHTRNHEILHEFTCYQDDPEMLDALCWGARHWRVPSTVGDLLNNDVSAYVDGVLCRSPQYSGETPVASDLASIFTMYSLGLAAEDELVDAYWAGDEALSAIQYCAPSGMQPNPFTVNHLTTDQLVQAVEHVRYRSPFFGRSSLNIGHAVYSHLPFSMAEIVYFDSDARLWGERTHWDGYGLVPFSFTTHGRMAANTPIGATPSVPDTDSDGDGVLDANDCALYDPAVWSEPLEVVALSVEAAVGSTDAIVSWSDQAASAGSGTRYDLISVPASELLGAGDFRAATCLRDDHAGGPYLDTRPDPEPGEAHFYLVRAQNICAGSGYGAGVRPGLLDGAATLPDPDPCH